jgi:hypothetical protein
VGTRFAILLVVLVCQPILAAKVFKDPILEPTEHGCALLWRMVSQLKPSQIELIDRTELEAWVKEHPKKFRPLARWIADRINVIPTDQLNEKALTQFDAFYKQLGPNDNVVFLIKDVFMSNKSNAYLTGAVTTKYPELQKFPVLGLEQDLKPYAKKNTKVVILDDAAYSGYQTQELVEKAEGAFSRDQIYVILGASTTKARKRVAARAHVSEGSLIPTIGEMLQADEKNKKPISALIKDATKIIGDYGPEEFLDYPLTLTDTTPDLMSFPEFLAEGRVIDDIELETPFLRKKTPLYKEPPYVDPIKR